MKIDVAAILIRVAELPLVWKRAVHLVYFRGRLSNFVCILLYLLVSRVGRGL